MVETGRLPQADARAQTREGGLFIPRTLRALLLPDVALVASCIALFYVLFLFSGYQKLFRDSDAGWHIRTGERILSTGELPRSDPYSFTRAGQPWLAWEWGADALMGAAHRAAGLSGVALLYGVAIAAGVWLWFRLHWAVGGNFLLACAMAAPMLSTCNLHWLARPHVLSWIFLLAAVLFLETAPERLERRHVWRIALFSALWTNVHASFFLGPLIAFLYAGCCAVRSIVWKPDADMARRSACVTFFYAGLVSTAATLVNPYGFQLHRHVFGYLTDSELLKRVGEFQSFDFQAGGVQILLAVGIAAMGGALALGQGKPAHFLLAAGLIGAALRSARGLPLVALVLLPLANGAITEALQKYTGWRPKIRAGVDAFLAYSAGLRKWDARMNGLALAPVVILAAFALLRTPAIAARTGFPSDQFPIQAAAQLEKLPAGARLFAPDKFGGYLIYRFNGRLKVFFDGRSDFYGAEFLKQYARLVQVRPGWQEQWNTLDVTHALLPNDYSLIPALEQLGWRVVYRDGTATLLARPTEIASPRRPVSPSPVSFVPTRNLLVT
jgi:hypothetical protein